jgi:predicted HicB family RNase H-like nuclease
MSDMLNYKGYVGSASYSSEGKVFHGKIEFIRDLVTYEGTDVDGLEAAFKESVDDYLAFCAEQGKEPEKPFKGSFNIRPGSRLHREAALYAREHGTNLNGVVVKALEDLLHS